MSSRGTEDNARPDLAYRRAARIFSMGLCMAVAACTVGPDFERPAQPHLKRYTENPVPRRLVATMGEPAQRIEVGKRISAQWWELFRSPELTSVVHQAIRENKTLLAARATLAAAEEEVAAARGGLYPQIEALANADRTRSSHLQTNATGISVPGEAPISNLYSVGATVSYATDVFGGTKRKVEQQQALADFQRYQLAAAYLTLTGNAVTDAITIASINAQIEATQDVITGDQQTLSLVRQAFDAGKVARADVLTAETQLASDETTLPALRQQVSTVRHALATLTGHAPATWAAPSFKLERFSLPRELPLTLPSRLVRQRPDILAAEAQLHADSAAIGVATAQLFPSITLSATLGQESLRTGTLFNTANQFWNLSGQILAPIFEGGTLYAQRRAAIDTYKASLATYEQTVLDSFQQVADTLKALQHDAELIGAQRLLLDTASESLKLQRISYAAGKTTLLNLIDAERVYQQARIAFVRSQAQRVRDSAQLFVALGGGWWQVLPEPDRPSPN